MKNVLLLLVIGASVFFSSCNKYPDDIPDWLKDKIKALNKESRWHKGCVNDHCMSIKELKKDGETYFFFDPGYNTTFEYQLYIVYNYDGNEVCQYVPSNPQPNCNYTTAQYIRLVWSEKE